MQEKFSFLEVSRPTRAGPPLLPVKTQTKISWSGGLVPCSLLKTTETNFDILNHTLDILV